jgi:hypothetical protein
MKGHSEKQECQTMKPTKELALNTPLLLRALSGRTSHLNKGLSTMQSFDSFT